MKWNSSRSLLSAGALALACGGAPPPAAQPTPAEQDTTDVDPKKSVGVDAPPLTPVKAPARVFAVGRLQNPERILDAAETWSPVPFKWRDELEKEEPGLLQVVNPAAPIDVIAALDEDGTALEEPEIEWVVSFPLASLRGAIDFARKQGERVRRLQPGMHVVGDNCIAARSLGAAPARMVCSDEPEYVESLVEYATRGLPSEDLGQGDLVFELRAKPFQERYGREAKRFKGMAAIFIKDELKLGYPPFDRAMGDVASALIDEGVALIDDLDKLRVEAALDTKSLGTSFSATLAMRGKKSWTAQTFEAAGKGSGTPPDMFWELPKDSTTASWAIGTDAKRYEPLRDKLAELLDAYLRHEKVPASAQKNITGLISKLWFTEGGSVYGMGPLKWQGTPKPDTPAFEREVMRTSLGWHVMGFEEKSTQLRGYLDHLVKAFNDPTLRRMLEKEEPDIKKVPLIRAGFVPGLIGARKYELTVPSEAFDSWHPPGAKKPAKAPALPVVLILVPDGDVTWVGLSADQKLLVEKLKQAKEGAKAKTLASRGGLEKLRSTKAVGGGYTTLQSLVDGGLQGMLTSLAAGGGAPAGIKEAFEKMPHKGATPIFFFSTVGKGPSVRWEWSVPGAVFEDLSPLLKEAFNFAQGMGMGFPGSSPPMPPPMPMPVPPPPPAPGP